MNRPRLSKSRFVSGTQCHLRLWYDTYERRLASPPDAALRAVFDTGHEVGALARARYPGGHLVARDHLHIREALDETQQVVDAGTTPVLFEAAFEHEGVLIRVDVIERLPDGGWRLEDVKSTTRLKDVFLRDVAIQLWVLQGAGLDVREAGVLTLDRGYIFDGVRLDLGALFRLHPVFDRASAMLAEVGAQARAMLAMLARPAAPEIAPGDHCFHPYACPYHAHCACGLAHPEHGVDELPRLAAESRAALEAAGIEGIRDVPADSSLTHLQRVVRRAVCEGRPLLHGGGTRALARFAPPVRHLDFETFAPAVPRFAGTRPYDAIPFLFSVHSEGEDDPRPPFAARLIEALGREGAVCVWSGYERRILRALAAALPGRAVALRAIEARLFDLLEPRCAAAITTPHSAARSRSRTCCRRSSPGWVTTTSRSLRCGPRIPG